MKNNLVSNLTISIVFGGKKKLIISCLDSIYKSCGDSIEIFVVSNCGAPEVVNEIRERFPNVNLIINKNIKGFAENHNLVIEKTNKKYILILNDDTIILDKAINKLIAYMEDHLMVGAISPKLLNPDFSLQRSVYSFPSLVTVFLNFSGLRQLIPFNKMTSKLVSMFYRKKVSRFWDHKSIRSVDTFRGACVLVRRAAIEEVGLMDEVSLAYGEETEWHYRFKEKGWDIVFYPEAEIIHYGQQTTSSSPKIRKEEVKGIINFYQKHKSPISCFFLRTGLFFIFLIKLLFNIFSFNEKKKHLFFSIIKIILNPKRSFTGKRIFY